MGLRDVLAGLLSSEGSRDRGGRDDGSRSGETTTDAGVDATDAQGGEGGASQSEDSFDVELEELDQEEQVEALEGRLDEMEGDIDRTHTELDTIKGSQQDVAEQLNEVNDTVRQLLGIYDQLTADVNPFMEGPTRDADPDAEGFGVVGGEEPDPDGDVVEAVTSDEPVEDEMDPVEDETDSVDDETAESTTIGLDDIRDEHEELDDDRGGVEPAEATQGADAAVVQEDEPADNEIEVEPTTDGTQMSKSDAQDDRFEEDVAWRDDPSPSRSTVTLDALADTYATEIIVFEWLKGLVSTAGPAATLRAIAYYEEIGWIDRQVKRYLEDVLSGPDLDMNVDPSRDPSELTAEDHAESYEYIMKLDAVQRTIEDTGL